MMNESTQVDHSVCAAPGCPLIGTNSRSTTGSGDWLCFIHFSTDPRNWLLATTELNRLGWLSEIVRRLRAVPRSGGFPELLAEAHKSITLSQRTDLLMKESEATAAWMIRLEGVLQQSCKDSAVQE